MPRFSIHRLQTIQQALKQYSSHNSRARENTLAILKSHSGKNKKKLKYGTSNENEEQKKKTKSDNMMRKQGAIIIIKVDDIQQSDCYNFYFWHGGVEGRKRKKEKKRQK